ncbi:hypothetical protein K440DRAFT_678887 [Wilcoxina mikolae CBS 423.85]|nr:hypothetical protein K440DRAFT_678887 [Wilcoxina mikolae CBS 423.85]
MRPPNLAFIGIVNPYPYSSRKAASSYYPTTLDKRDASDKSISFASLVATILGVIVAVISLVVAAIGIFGTRFWKFKRVGVTSESIDLLPRVRSPDEIPIYPPVGIVNHYHYHVPHHSTATMQSDQSGLHSRQPPPPSDDSYRTATPAIASAHQAPQHASTPVGT